MKINTFPGKLTSGKKVMVLGSFNSFHFGHEKLLKTAKKHKKKVVFLLIDNLSILENTHKKPYHSLEIRLQHLANIGVDEVLLIKFNNEIKKMDGKSFAKTLFENYNVEKFIVGKDFSMGENSKYKSSDLAKDFDTEIVEEFKVNDKKISTSILREMVEFGDVHSIKKVSPFYFTKDFRIMADKTFKTEGLMPHNGVYAAWTIVNDVKYWSAVLVSKNKNIVHIPDLLVENAGFDSQIEFVKKVRAIIKNNDDVISEEDIKKTIEILKNDL